MSTVFPREWPSNPFLHSVGGARLFADAPEHGELQRIHRHSHEQEEGRRAVAAAVHLRKDHRDARAEAGEHKDEQVHDRALNAHRRKRLHAQIATDDQGVHRVVHLLQHAADQQRQRQRNQLPADVSLQ